MVNKYHGEQNGVTKAFTTSYFYQIAAEGLQEFLPALVDALKEPLFSEENIKKEVNNVNSEISMRMTFNKNLAYYKLIKTIGNKESKLFSDGFSNIDTKSIDYAKLRSQIIEFHEKYYSSNLMTLTIITEKSLAEIQDIVTPMFETIPNKKVARPFFNETASYVSPFSPDVLGNVYYLQAFTEPAKFSMIFQVPSGKSKTMFQPLEFFSFILNYFSEKSLREVLIQEQLVSSFSDSVALQDYVKAVYIVTFVLTPGIDSKIGKIVKHFFQFVSYVKKLANKDTIYKAYSKTSKYGFMFNIKNEFINFSNVETDLFDRCLDFSETLQDFPPDMVFTLNNILYSYNESEFNELLNLLTPENSVYLIESKEFKTDPSIAPQASIVASPEVRQRELRLVENDIGVGQYHMRLMKSQINSDVLNIDYIPGRILADSLQELNSPDNSKSQSNSVQIADNGENRSSEEESNSIFDSISGKELKFAFDFDNNRQYEVTAIKKTLLTSISKSADSSDAKYEIPEAIDTSHLDHFYIETTCQTPQSLTVEGQAAGSKKLLSNSSEIRTIFGNSKIDTVTIFEVILNEKTTEEANSMRKRVITDLDDYKKCLSEQFEGDKNNQNPVQVSNQPFLSTYSALYRRTLQPESVVIIDLESENMINMIKNSSPADRITEFYKLDLFCLYVSRHFKLSFHEYFLKGSVFTCQAVNGRILLSFKALSDILDDFIATLLSSLSDFKIETTYKLYSLNNLKQQMINERSQFDSITSLKLSMFYLNLLMDKNFVDNSSPEKLEKIKETISSIDQKTLADLCTNILHKKKLIITSVGVQSKEKEGILAKNIANLLNEKQASEDSEKEIDIVGYRNHMIEHFSLKFETQQHSVIRLDNHDKVESNSVYLTYFNIGRITREMRFSSQIMVHFMRKHVFEVLRNQMNLGYVAQAGLKVFYKVE